MCGVPHAPRDTNCSWVLLPLNQNPLTRRQITAASLESQTMMRSEICQQEVSMSRQRTTGTFQTQSPHCRVRRSRRTKRVDAGAPLPPISLVLDPITTAVQNAAKAASTCFTQTVWRKPPDGLQVVQNKC